MRRGLRRWGGEGGLRGRGGGLFVERGYLAVGGIVGGLGVVPGGFGVLFVMLAGVVGK